MNKYMGFYELKASKLPAVSWKLFEEDTELDEGMLWTIRVAVESSSDLNLPRYVGVGSKEAAEKARELLKAYSGRGIVIYYPYFIAYKSGVLDVNSHRTVIEAVDKDLWNLVTYGRKNVTAVFPFQLHDKVNIRKADNSDNVNSCGLLDAANEDCAKYIGDEYFLTKEEKDELLKYSTIIRGKFRNELIEGKSILAEWSYAFNSDVYNQPSGDRYLVFYELRSL